MGPRAGLDGRKISSPPGFDGWAMQDFEYTGTSFENRNQRHGKINGLTFPPVICVSLPRMLH